MPVVGARNGEHEIVAIWLFMRNIATKGVSDARDTMAAMPMYFPQDFVLSTAAFCANLTNHAYDQYKQWHAQQCRDMSSFNWTKPDLPGYSFSTPLFWSYNWAFENYQEPFGFLTWMDGTIYIVFRGTNSDMDRLYDLKIDQTPYALVSGFGNVHRGFYEIYSKLSPLVLAALAAARASSSFTQVIFTGHSLGSGLSSLAVPDVVANGGLGSGVSYLHINLASPRVGDLTYARAMNGGSVPTFRVVNTEDIVPTAPLSCDTGGYYQHIGTSVDFTANYLSFENNHSLTESYIYALANPQSPENESTLEMSAKRGGGPRPIGQHPDDGHVSAAALIAAAGAVALIGTTGQSPKTNE